jgi:hypothetical protein
VSAIERRPVWVRGQWVIVVIDDHAEAESENGLPGDDAVDLLVSELWSIRSALRDLLNGQSNY